MNATQLTHAALLRAAMLLALFSTGALGSEKQDFSPRADERQLPRAMHSKMKDQPQITVGRRDAEILGADNRVLQAAVDYIAGLGGGVVEIKEGEFLMRDSLHLRSFVSVRGTKGKTILRKARAAASPLALDGDYGEEQVTLVNPDGFKVGDGIAIWDSQSGGFHTTVARITGQNGNTFSIDTPLNADCMLGNKARPPPSFRSSPATTWKVRVWKISSAKGTRRKMSISTAVVAPAFFSIAALAPSSRIVRCETIPATGSASSNPTTSSWRVA